MASVKVTGKVTSCETPNSETSAEAGADSPQNESIIDIAELLDGSVRKNWLKKSKWVEREAEGKARLESVDKKLMLPAANFNGSPWACPCWLPLPDVGLLDKIEREMDARTREAPLGPITSEYRETVLDWAWGLRLRYRGSCLRVRGSWGKNAAHWRALLNVLSRKERERPLKIISRGSGLPWNEMPPGPIRCPRTGGCPRNHKELWVKKDFFWETLEEQLMEGAVVPWDCAGRDDCDVLPKGMFPVRWVIKAGTLKVRITINMMALNEWLNKLYCSVELPSVRRCRYMHHSHDWKSGLDCHSSYYHGEYEESVYTWVGFSVGDDELPEEAVKFLWKNFPQCRWRDRWVFCYASFAMGCSASVSDFQCVMSAAVKAMERSGVGAAYGLTLQQWRGLVFIDDESASSRGGPVEGLRNGSGFGNALELSLRILATFLWLGTDINFKKSQIIPRRDSIFLGIGHDTRLMRFFLSMKRCQKMRERVRALRNLVKIGERVLAKEVARLIGALWSVMVVAHRAVAMMTRGLIRVIAVMLNMPELLGRGANLDIKWLLKAAWRGYVTWTLEADGDLCFWEVVPWELLWSAMGYDVFDEAMVRCVALAVPDELADDVIVVASDASDIAIGGGVFRPEGEGRFTRVTRCNHVLQRPRGSSTVREMEGSVKTVVATKPNRGMKVLGVTDNQSVERIMKKCSGVEELARLARWFFMWCLYNEVLYHQVWQPRTSKIIVPCDDDSRLVDRCNYSANPGLFWEANSVAVRLWGCGFSYDRFASMEHVQPSNCAWKIPFTARFRQLGASGTDAFAENWRGHVNWINAPFGLLGKVYYLLRSQRAVAAVVVPSSCRRWWSTNFYRHSEGVVARLNFGGRDPRCIPLGPADAPRSLAGLSVVFIDFRRRSDVQRLGGGCTAEGLWDKWMRAGAPPKPTLYCQPSGKFVSGPPTPSH